MSTVLFIENEYQTERHFTRGFRLGAIRSNWKPEVTWLRNKEGDLRSAEELSREMESYSPDLIVWIMDHALPRAEAFETPKLLSIPKASLWLDDYHRTHAIHAHAESHKRLAEKASLNTYVWDGYWRKKFQEKFSVPCLPIHLAADEVDYFPAEATHFKELDDYLIFIGTIPSLDHILKEASCLPQPCQRLVQDVVQITGQSEYGRMPYDVLQESYEALAPKMKVVVDQFRQDIANNVVMNRLAWMIGKREVRLRILRLAVKQHPLAIMSGHSDKSFAGADELSKEIKAKKYALKFVNTDHVLLHQLGSLYHSGKLHLQATDPQSVEGGIPFRVFEAAASGRPLLSDYKKELGDCFQPDQEILCFQNDEDFADKLYKALKNPAQLKEIGKASHQRFLKEHTWKHRFQQISNK